jgi:hypothetical protein
MGRRNAVVNAQFLKAIDQFDGFLHVRATVIDSWKDMIVYIPSDPVQSIFVRRFCLLVAPK